MTLETWELLFYVITVVGLPFAIAVFIHERGKYFRACLPELLRGEKRGVSRR